MDMDIDEIDELLEMLGDQREAERNALKRSSTA